MSKKDGGLRFKELEAFNFSLLEKHRWRLIKHENSLVARVLRAKYHVHEGFFDAKERNGISLIWRSIVKIKNF